MVKGLRIAAHQPHCYPWIGFFHKMTLCDRFILYDDVQFEKGDWQNRNYVKTRNGRLMLSIPVVGGVTQLINEKEINNAERWQRKHWQTLLHAYGHAPFWNLHRDWLAYLFSRKWLRLIDFSLEVINYTRIQLAIDVPLVLSSSLSGLEGRKTDRVLSLCVAVEAKTFVSGVGARVYLDTDKLNAAGIGVEWQDFTHPVYEQQFMELGFLGGMSCLDLMLNHGPAAGEFVRGAGQ